MLSISYLYSMKVDLQPIEKQDFRSASAKVRKAIGQRGISKSGNKKGYVADLFSVNKNTVIP